MKYLRIRSGLPIVLTLVFLYNCSERPVLWREDSAAGPIKVELVADSIAVPFGMAFLSGKTLLVSDRATGEILKVDLDSGRKLTIKGVPVSYCHGDGGALDILPHPQFETNHLIYFSHAVGDSTGSTLAIERGKLLGDSLTGVKRLFTAYPFYREPNHYGSRMVLHNGYLFFTMGERYDLRDSAQSLGNHLGKVMRIKEDGEIPSDNPFVNTPGAKPEIWSYGHRNPQGLLFNEETGQLLLNEHGPRGGDELNVIQPGLNYGWPEISFGVNYDGTVVGTGNPVREGMVQPLYQYTPSIAPSGMELYKGKKIPSWENSLFIGALALRHLNRLVIKNNKVVLEERLLDGFEKRVRVVKEGPDGYLYIGVDGGMILRIRPD